MDNITSFVSDKYTAAVPAQFTSLPHQIWIKPVNLVIYANLAVVQVAELVARVAFGALLLIPLILSPLLPYSTRKAFQGFFSTHLSIANLARNFLSVFKIAYLALPIIRLSDLYDDEASCPWWVRPQSFLEKLGLAGTCCCTSIVEEDDPLLLIDKKAREDREEALRAEARAPSKTKTYHPPAEVQPDIFSDEWVRDLDAAPEPLSGYTAL